MQQIHNTMAAERVEAEGEEGFASPVFPSSQTTMVFVTMLFLGASTLFPWLAYITATGEFRAPHTCMVCSNYPSHIYGNALCGAVQQTILFRNSAAT